MSQKKRARFERNLEVIGDLFCAQARAIHEAGEVITYIYCNGDHSEYFQIGPDGNLEISSGTSLISPEEKIT